MKELFNDMKQMKIQIRKKFLKDEPLQNSVYLVRSYTKKKDFKMKLCPHCQEQFWIISLLSE